MVYVEVSLLWRRAGGAAAIFRPGTREIYDVRMPTAAPGRAGIYRISIDLIAGRAVYIGEGASISHRLYQYTRVYKGKKSTTETRMSRRIRKALAEGKAVSVDTATTGKIDLAGSERPLEMENVAERRFAEAAAVLAEAEQDIDGKIIVLNRILDEDWWLSD